MLLSHKDLDFGLNRDLDYTHCSILHMSQSWIVIEYYSVTYLMSSTHYSADLPLMVGLIHTS